MSPEDIPGPTALLAAPSTVLEAPPPPAPPPAARIPESPLDPEQWGEIEKLWRGTAMPARDIAESFGIRQGVLERHAERAGWQRDLAGQTRAHLERRALEYDAAIAEQLPASPDDQVAFLAARTQHTVLLAHRADISEIRRVARRIARKLHAHLDAIDQFEADEDSNEKRKNYLASRRILGERETVGDLMEKLSRATERAVNMERLAWGLGREEGDSPLVPDEALTSTLEQMDPDDRARLREAAASLAGATAPAPR